MYKRKTKDIYIIMTNYGYSFEEEDTADTKEELYNLVNEYRIMSYRPLIKVKRKRIKI